MLNKISKLLTGDMLKILCDMGHGDEIVIADANFPGETVAKRLIHCPGVSATALLSAIVDIFPLDVDYVEHPAEIMELTQSDQDKGVPAPAIWAEFENTLQKDYPALKLGKIERFAFYERARQAYAVIQTGEERVYGNLLLVKGTV